MQSARQQMAREGEVLWTAPAEMVQSSNLASFRRHLSATRDLQFETYQDLWAWSVTELEDFWQAIWEFGEVRAASPPTAVLAERAMPGARWFEGATLNFAEHALRAGTDGEVALVFKREGDLPVTLTWGWLRGQVAGFAARLIELGVKPGDRVVGYLPNCPEAVVAFLATAAIGAVWSTCSPDFGTRSVVERFKQIAPRVLIAADGYRYAGRNFDRLDVVAELEEELTSLERVVLVPYLGDAGGLARLRSAELWTGRSGHDLQFTPVPFGHPLWILYSSGTTGAPKGIVHGHGGILLGVISGIGLHFDIRPKDRLFWFTTTGWVMWNIVVSALVLGASTVLYDGAPHHPGQDALWAIAAETEATVFGASAAYLAGCLKAGVRPRDVHDLSRVRAISYAGSPLPPEGWAWIYESACPDAWVSTVSGGTDILVPFVGSAPELPVTAGEFGGKCLGVDVHAYGPSGEPLVDEVGELVVTSPLPSMPLHFWNDAGGERYHGSYFDVYPGVWRHGDWIRFRSDGRSVIYGRSDATINRSGVRMGSGEIYRIVEELPEIADSLIVDLTALGQESWMPLFVSLAPGAELTPELIERIGTAIRGQLSPRHVPDAVIEVGAIPRTLNNKKLEVPVKRILSGVPLEKAVNLGSVSNPESLDFFTALEASRRQVKPSDPGDPERPRAPET